MEEIIQEDVEQKVTDAAKEKDADEGVKTEEVIEEVVVEENEEQKKIEALEKEISEMKDKYVRKMAEFDNYKKRLEREKEDFLKYANEKIILKVLETVDNLERAVSSSKNTKDFDAIFKGVEMTIEHFRHLLEVEGIKVLESVGKEFNPYEHHAVMTEESEHHETNMILEEFQKGYKMKEKIIRPALVKVAKKK